MPKTNLCINHEAIFSENMEVALVRKKVTKKSISEKTGASRSTICRYYQKPRTMTLDMLKQIIKLTNIPKEDVINYLYEGRQQEDKP